MSVGNFFKQDVIDYIKYDKHIKDQEKILREHKKKRSALETNILNYMVKNKLSNSDIKAGTSKLRYQENKTKTGLNQKFLKSKLEEYFLEKHSNLGEEKCLNIANDIYNYIENGRIYKTKLVLKRICLN
jgi:uncharacterized protein YyaL (SSP411 family)